MSDATAQPCPSCGVRPLMTDRQETTRILARTRLRQASDTLSSLLLSVESAPVFHALGCELKAVRSNIEAANRLLSLPDPSD